LGSKGVAVHCEVIRRGKNVTEGDFCSTGAMPKNTLSRFLTILFFSFSTDYFNFHLKNLWEINTKILKKINFAKLLTNEINVVKYRQIFFNNKYSVSIIIFFLLDYIYKFMERTVLLKLEFKILVRYRFENNFIRLSNMMINIVKNFDILATNLSVLYNYLDSLTKLFSNWHPVSF